MPHYESQVESSFWGGEHVVTREAVGAEDVVAGVATVGFALLGGLISGSVGLVQEARYVKASQRLDAAMREFYSGHTETAFSEVNQVIGTFPREFTPYTCRGIMYAILAYREQRQDMHDWAIADWSYALGSCENAWGANLGQMHPTLLSMRGDLYLENGNLMAALADARLGTKAHPENPVFHILTSKVLLALDDFDAAMRSIETAMRVAITPSNYFQRGKIYDKMGEYTSAVGDYTRAISLAHFEVTYYIYRAEANIHLNKVDAAVTDVDVTKQLQPDLIDDSTPIPTTTDPEKLKQEIGILKGRVAIPRYSIPMPAAARPPSPSYGPPRAAQPPRPRKASPFHKFMHGDFEQPGLEDHPATGTAPPPRS